MQINLKQAYQNVCQQLNGIENYKIEASELMRFSTHVSKSDLIIGDKIITMSQYDDILMNVNRRKNGYPLQYILGEWEFFGLPFKVGEGVLIPRPDTELLVETALKVANNRPNLKILDICSGSGCIAIAIAKNLPNSSVYALEKSNIALSYLERNVMLNDVAITVINTDALNPQFCEDEFDIIVSNPPYLTKDDMDALQREVTFEPAMALYAEFDGLHFYRELTAIWRKYLKVGGTILYEVGHKQSDDVEKILLQNDFNSICKTKDIYGILRVVSGIR